MICENGYKLNLKNGEVLTFKTDLDLDTYIDDLLKLHPNAVNTSDFITRAVDFQKNTVEILDEISKKVSSVSRPVYKADDYDTVVASEDPEDKVAYYIIDKSIGVTRFLTDEKVRIPSTGNPFAVKFDEESWKQNRIQALKEDFTKEGMSLEEAEKQAEQQVAVEMLAWDTFSETGTEVHKIYELVFSGKPCTYDPKFNTKLTPTIFDSIKKNLRTGWYPVPRALKFLVKIKKWSNV